MSVLRDAPSMTIGEFLAFTEQQPDEGRWELIDGEPILNPSPSYGHQKVVKNLVLLLGRLEDGAPWEMLPGLGVKLSDRRMPVPDVLIRSIRTIEGHYCEDMTVAFEVISPSSRSRDLGWKRQAYATLPSLQHYVVLSQTAADIRCYDRATDWAERRHMGGSAVVPLAAVGLDLPATALYAGTGLL